MITSYIARSWLANTTTCIIETIVELKGEAMKLVEYDINKIEGAKIYKKTENMKILEEFIESGMDCAKIEGFNQNSAMGCAASLNSSIKRYNLGGIRAISRKRNCYLVKIQE